jgi:hypothetical protein
MYNYSHIDLILLNSPQQNAVLGIDFVSMPPKSTLIQCHSLRCAGVTCA